MLKKTHSLLKNLYSFNLCDSFHLQKKFVNEYRKTKPDFGFNGLGELVYKTRYARIKEDGSKEDWVDTIERVVNGTYKIQEEWFDSHNLGWNERRAQESAKQMFDRFFSMKCLPPGRGLWAMGSPITDKKHLYAALNNCGFVSTDAMRQNVIKPFQFMMDMMMLGVGVGFDCKGADQKIFVHGFNTNRFNDIISVEDSREGWVDSIGVLIRNYIEGGPITVFDYSKIRPKGAPIKSFGGISSGSESLKNLHESIANTLRKNVGKYLSITSIVDIMNHIGISVVAGNVKRSAEISFGDPYSEEYINLKNYNVNPHRIPYGGMSNNSVFAELGMSYDRVSDLVSINGEPGFAWLDKYEKIQ